MRIIYHIHPGRAAAATILEDNGDSYTGFALCKPGDPWKDHIAMQKSLGRAQGAKAQGKGHDNLVDFEVPEDRWEEAVIEFMHQMLVLKVARVEARDKRIAERKAKKKARRLLQSHGLDWTQFDLATGKPYPALPATSPVLARLLELLDWNSPKG